MSAGERGLASELTDLDEDVIDASAMEATADTVVHDTIIPGAAVMRSEPTQTVYLERSSELVYFHLFWERSV